MTNAFTEKKLKEFDELFIGNNTRGIVTFEEGLGGVNYHKAICDNCGKTFKGKEAEKMMFGHIGCPKPNGQYIKNDVSPEKLKSFLQSAIVEADKKAKLDERITMIGIFHASIEEYYGKDFADSIMMVVNKYASTMKG